MLLPSKASVLWGVLHKHYVKDLNIYIPRTVFHCIRYTRGYPGDILRISWRHNEMLPMQKTHRCFEVIVIKYGVFFESIHGCVCKLEIVVHICVWLICCVCTRLPLTHLCTSCHFPTRVGCTLSRKSTFKFTLSRQLVKRKYVRELF